MTQPYQPSLSLFINKNKSDKDRSTCNLPLSPWELASASTRAQTASGRTAEGSSSPKASVRRGFLGIDQKVPLQSIGSQGTGRFWGRSRFGIGDFGTDEWTCLPSSPSLAANGIGLMILWAWLIHQLPGGPVTCFAGKTFGRGLSSLLAGRPQKQDIKEATNCTFSLLLCCQPFSNCNSAQILDQLLKLSSECFKERGLVIRISFSSCLVLRSPLSL